MCFAHETMLRNRVLLHASSAGCNTEWRSDPPSELFTVIQATDDEVYLLVSAETVLLGFVLLAVAGLGLSG